MFVFNMYCYFGFQEKPDGSPVFIAFRSSTKKSVQYDDVPEYKDRLSLSENYTLSINNAKISDEKRFVCMLVTEDNVFEAPTLVKVFSKQTAIELLSGVGGWCQKVFFRQNLELSAMPLHRKLCK